jgi:hypothetical protein
MPLDHTISAFEHLQALIANGPDLEDLDEHDDLMTRLAAFCKSGTLLSAIEAFCVQHAADGFADHGEASEFPLEWTSLHEEYSVLIERALGDFLVSQRVSSEDFYAHCRTVLDQSRADSRWNRDAMVVTVFIGSSEFEEWVALMKSIANTLFGEDEDGGLAPPDLT